MAKRSEYEPTTWLRGARASLLLAVLVVVLGAVVAAAVGVLLMGLATLIDRALG